MKQFLLVLVAFTLFFSCNNTNQEVPSPNTNPTNTQTDAFQLPATADSLYHLVGATHDTAMLLMSNIANARAAVRKVMNDNSRLKAVEEVCLEKLLALNQADDAMMDWMHEFKSVEMDEEVYQKWSEQETMQYLQQEQTKIEQVHQQMLESIAEAKKLVAEYK